MRCHGVKVKATSTGSQRVIQNGERDGAKDSRKAVTHPISQRVTVKEREANREKGKDLENVTTVASQDIGQENVLNPKGSSMLATTVARRVTRQRSHPKVVGKERALTRSVETVNGCGSKPHRVTVVTPTKKLQSAARSPIKLKVCA